MTTTELEQLIVRLVGDASSYQRMLRDAQQQTAAAARQIEYHTSRIESSFGLRRFALNAMGALTPLIGTISILGTAFHGVKLAAELEQVEVAFETMLKGAERGKQMVADLVDLAAKTPLRLTDVQRAAKLLLQFGEAGDDIIPTLRMLGDVTGGDAERFQRMALAFGQMSSAGRLMGQDLLQMIQAGFNPLQEISRTTGKSMAQLRDQMHQGQITVQMVRDAFRSATSVGGQFFNLMEKQSQSTSGLFSTMLDDVDSFMRALGRNIIELFHLKDAMRAVSAGTKVATEWLQAVPMETMRIIVVVAAATAAVTAFGLAWPVLASIAAPVLRLLAGLTTFLLTPLGLVAVALATLTGTWVSRLGGLGVVWDEIRAAAVRAWEWIEPVWSKLHRFAEFIGVGLKTAWQATGNAIYNFIAGIDWNEVQRKAGEVWGWVRQRIQEFVDWAMPIWDAFVKTIGTQLVVFGGVAGTVWEGIKASAEPVGAALRSVGEWIGMTVNSAREAIGVAAGLAVGVWAAQRAFAALALVLGVMNGVLASLHIQQLAGVALWGTWTAAVVLAKGAVLLAQGVMLLFNAQLAAWTFLLSAGAVASAVWSVAAGIATAATWLWNAALTGLNVLLAPATLLAAAGTVVVLSAAFAGVTAAISGVYQMAMGLSGAFDHWGQAAQGPLVVIGGMLNEWLGIIKDVVRAVQVDGGLAWKILQAGVELAVAQVRALWPPLWKFIQTGFLAVWDLITGEFQATVTQALQHAKAEFAKFFESIFSNKIAEDLKDFDKHIERVRQTLRRLTEERIQKAGREFKFEEGPAADEARQKIEALRKELAALEQQAGDHKPAEELSELLKKERVAFEAGQKAGNAFGNAFGKHAKHGVDKFDAALYDSAEAATRTMNYLDKLREAGTDGAALAPQAAQAAQEAARPQVGLGPTEEDIAAAAKAVEASRQAVGAPPVNLEAELAKAVAAADEINRQLQARPFVGDEEQMRLRAELEAADRRINDILDQLDLQEQMRKSQIESILAPPEMVESADGDERLVVVLEQVLKVNEEMRDLARERDKEPALEVKFADWT